jgi:Tn3 transposase DDE domain
MAELTGIPADTIDWYTRWYLREATLRPANTGVVNEHFHHPFARAWGGGTLSSSDGLRFPMRGKSLTARHLSRYFLSEGVTSYTHVSDQHSTYGTQIIVSTERDATYVLDEILGNTTELPILEHATDTRGSRRGRLARTSRRWRRAVAAGPSAQQPAAKRVQADAAAPPSSGGPVSGGWNGQHRAAAGQAWGAPGRRCWGGWCKCGPGQEWFGAVTAAAACWARDPGGRAPALGPGRWHPWHAGRS